MMRRMYDTAMVGGNVAIVAADSVGKEVWMRIYLAEMFVVSLLLTVVTELVVVHILLWRPERHLKWRKRLNTRTVLLATLVNILTNPPAVLLCWLGRMYLPSALHFPVQIAVEAIVVATEAYVYCSFAVKPEWGIKRPVLLSCATNGCSWLLGMIVMALRH